MLQNGHLQDETAIHPDYTRSIVMSNVYDVVRKTELTPAVHLSRRAGCQLLLKREDQQLGFSPHVRGAYNCLSHVLPENRWRGIVIPSLGHYARGIAISAQFLKIQAVILIDDKTPDQEVHELRQMGCAVLKASSASALDPLSAALRMQAPCINPLNDPYTLAGMATVGLEILKQVKEPQQLEGIFCSARAGGALEAIGLSVKRFAPHVRVIGVDTMYAAESSELYGLLCHSSIADKQLEILNSFAAAPERRQVGSHDYGDGEIMTEAARINAEVVDEVIMVESLEIQVAVKDTFRETRGMVDFNGALAVAGMIRYASTARSLDPQKTPRTLVAVISSADVGFEDLKTLLF